MLLILLLLLCTSLTVHADSYAKASSLSEAKQIATEQNLVLKDYSYGIATYEGEGDLAHDYKIPKSAYSDQKDVFNPISLKNTYEHNITGKGAVVAILDTGCDVNHTELRRNIIGGCNVASSSTPNDINDTDGHGTHIAGIIAAADDNKGIRGIAPDASLYIIKISRENMDGFYHSDIIRGINKCIELGNIDIINMSFGGYHSSDLLKEAIQSARNHGILVVAAAGNNSTSMPMYPASYQVGLSVGSCNKYKSISYFSNKGTNYNILAPGENIYSTFPGNSYITKTGTSMSAPIVCGVAALVVSKYNLHHNADTVKNMLLNGTDNNVVNVQKIFNLSEIKIPKEPKIKITEDSKTLQQKVTITSGKNTDIFYTIDKSKPNIYSAKANHSIIFDKKGTYVLKVVSAVSDSRVYSKVKVIKVKVNKKVYSRKYLDSLKISYSKGKIVLKSKKYRRKLNYNIVRWTSSNKRIATVDQDGKVVFYKKGIVTIIANIGGFKKKIILKK